MPNSSIIPITGRTQATQTLYNNVVKDALRMLQIAGSNKTISSGAITVSPSSGEGHYQVDTESSAATDNLDTINGGAAGDVITLVSANSGRVITLRSGIGNITLQGGANVTLDTDAGIMLRYTGSAWKPIGGTGGSNTSNMTNKSGNDRVAGDVVIFDTANANSFLDTTTALDIRAFGVLKADIPNNASGPVYTNAGQIATINCTSAAVSIGMFLSTSTTAGKAVAAGYFRAPGVFAIALSSKAGGSTGTVQAMLIDNFRQAIIGTAGWAMGGNDGGGTVSTTQKMTMANETWASVAGAALGAARYSGAGLGAGTTAAYSVLGTSSTSHTAGTNSRYKIPYSTETTSTLTNSGVTKSYFRNGSNFPAKGFYSGGTNTGGSIQSSSGKTTFATDTDAAGNALTSGRHWQGGLSDGTYAYIGGGQSTATDKLDDATETISASAGSALGNSEGAYNFVSFPASAGYRCYNDGAGTVYSRKLTFATGADANNASSPSGSISVGYGITDGVAYGYVIREAAANKLDASTGTYSTLSNYSNTRGGSVASYGAY